MRTPYALACLAALTATACTPDNVFHPTTKPNVSHNPGEISGRICDPSGKTWLQDAQVYTNILDDNDRIIDTRIAYTDRDGYYNLSELPSETAYYVHVQYGASFLTDQESANVWVSDGQSVDLPQPDCFDPLEISVAIISGSYDSFELVLQNMGFANYTLIDGNDKSNVLGFLSDLSVMQSYDIIFFDGGFVEPGVIYPEETVDPTGLGGADTAAPDPSEAAIQDIRDYVAGGGSVYASDWAYDVVEQAFPTRLEFVGDDSVPNAAQLGEYDEINAAVTDGSLGTFLGSDYIDIQYDLPVWAPVESTDDSCTVHLSGNVAYRVGQNIYTLPTSPLLISFGSGEGKVVYSTFRVAKNASSDMLQVLQYMMYNL